jgi:hypothetical protein
LKRHWTASSRIAAVSDSPRVTSESGGGVVTSCPIVPYRAVQRRALMAHVVPTLFGVET